jgi:hypothetical protein
MGLHRGPSHPSLSATRRRPCDYPSSNPHDFSLYDAVSRIIVSFNSAGEPGTEQFNHFTLPIRVPTRLY